MARAKRKAVPVPSPPDLPVPRGPRVLRPPIAVRHVASVRDARGDVVIGARFERPEDANRFARAAARQFGRGGNRVAQVEKVPVRQVSQTRQPETSAQRAARYNRVSLGDAALLELIAPRSKPSPAPSPDALLEMLAAAADDGAGLLLHAFGVSG